MSLEQGKLAPHDLLVRYGTQKFSDLVAKNYEAIEDILIVTMDVPIKYPKFSLDIHLILLLSNKETWVDPICFIKHLDELNAKLEIENTKTPYPSAICNKDKIIPTDKLCQDDEAISKIEKFSEINLRHKYSWGVHNSKAHWIPFSGSKEVKYFIKTLEAANQGITMENIFNQISLAINSPFISMNVEAEKEPMKDDPLITGGEMVKNTVFGQASIVNKICANLSVEDKDALMLLVFGGIDATAKIEGYERQIAYMKANNKDNIHSLEDLHISVCKKHANDLREMERKYDVMVKAIQASHVEAIESFERQIEEFNYELRKKNCAIKSIPKNIYAGLNVINEGKIDAPIHSFVFSIGLYPGKDEKYYVPLHRIGDVDFTRLCAAIYQEADGLVIPPDLRSTMNYLEFRRCNEVSELRAYIKVVNECLKNKIPTTMFHDGLHRNYRMCEKVDNLHFKEYVINSIYYQIYKNCLKIGRNLEFLERPSYDPPDEEIEVGDLWYKTFQHAYMGICQQCKGTIIRSMYGSIKHGSWRVIQGLEGLVLMCGKCSNKPKLRRSRIIVKLDFDSD